MTSIQTDIEAAASRLRHLRVQLRYRLVTRADVQRAERELADLRKAGEGR